MLHPRVVKSFVVALGFLVLVACSDPRNVALMPSGAGGTQGLDAFPIPGRDVVGEASGADQGSAMAVDGQNPAVGPDGGTLPPPPAVDGPSPVRSDTAGPDLPPPPPSMYRLVVDVTGDGKVEDATGTFICDTHCERDLPAGTTLTFTAKATAAQRFAGWSKGCSGKQTCTVVMTEFRELLAEFKDPAVQAWTVGQNSDVISVAERGGNVFSMHDVRMEFDGTAPAKDRRDVVITRRSLETGQMQWQTRYRSVGDSLESSGVGGIAINESNEVIVTGFHKYEVDFGGIRKTPTVQGDNGYVAVLDMATGSTRSVQSGVGGLWAAHRGESVIVGTYNHGWRYQSPNTISRLNPSDRLLPQTWEAHVGPNLDLFLSGEYSTPMQFGSSSLGTSPSSRNATFSKMSPSHAPQWASALVGSNSNSIGIGFDVTVDSAGDVYGVGLYSGTVRIGGKAITSAGDDDGFIVKLSGSTGAMLWLKSFGGPNQDIGGSAAIARDGNLLVAGNGAIEPGKDATTFLAALNPADGSTIWVQNVPNSALIIEVASTGDVLMGSFGQGLTKFTITP